MESKIDQEIGRELHEGIEIQYQQLAGANVR